MEKDTVLISLDDYVRFLFTSQEFCNKYPAVDWRGKWVHITHEELAKEVQETKEREDVWLGRISECIDRINAFNALPWWKRMFRKV